MRWMEIEVRADGEALKVAARGDRGERARERTLPGFTVRELLNFRVLVGNAIARVQELDGEALAQARTLYEAIFAGELRDLFVALSTANEQRPLLIRWLCEDSRLQAVPWEALCRPDSSHGFLAGAADMLVARGVHSVKPWQPRELRRALRVLPVLAIPDRSVLDGLELALREHIESGAIEFLPAIEGDAARNPMLFERLRSGPSPHVLHFLGHGGFDSRRNPVIRLSDASYGERSQLPIEVFAEELRANFNTMRLIYLQACSGARPGAFGSAAQLLARAGVDAIVAHLWPVRAEVARAAALDFYTHLVGARSGSGDIAASVQSSRRTLLASGADGFSPVLYLRGPDSRLFDLEGRRLRPPKKSPPRAATTDKLPTPLRTLLSKPFSMILGAAWDDETLAEVRTRFRESLLVALQTREEDERTTPLFSLAQRHALQAGRRKLDRLFQRVVRAVRASANTTLLDALTRRLRPGVHVTLSWLPLLEHTIARHNPDALIYSIQPGPPGHDERRMIMVREPGDDDWEEIETLKPLRLENTYVILRLYGGYSPESQPMLVSPQLTEDDYIQGHAGLRYIVPSEWDNQIMGWLRTRPALCVGLSALDWRHRMLLRWLYDQRPLPPDSVALLAETQDERELWAKRGAGLPGGGSIAVVQEPAAALVQALEGALS